MDIKEMFEAKLKEASELEEKGLNSTEEIEAFNTVCAEAEGLKKDMEKRASGQALLKGLTVPMEKEAAVQAKSLGEFAVDAVKDQLAELKDGRVLYAPEFKANEILTSAELQPFATQYDSQLVIGKRERPVVADLLSASTITGAAISYLVEGAKTGDFGWVAEGAAKPQLGFATPKPVTESLAKLAGWIKVSEEFRTDYPGLMDEINNRLVYELMVAEEKDLLAGTGAAGGIKGLLNREGVQTLTATKKAENADVVYKATTAISTATDLVADGIVLNPADYEAFRLSKDANNQYYGGGFFTGAYGIDGVVSQPNLWGLKTIITPAIAKGTALVGSFRMGGTVYRKGGVSVAFDTAGDDFLHNMMTVRAEERIALAVRVPQAFAKVTLSDAAGA